MVSNILKVCFLLALISQSYEFDLTFQDVSIKSEIEGESWECKEKSCIYEYTEEKNKIHFICSANDATPAGNMTWKIAQTTGDLFKCHPVPSRDIHYIAILGKKHDGTQLYCEHSAHKQSTSVKLYCTNCVGEDSKPTNTANCANFDSKCPITTYINGNVSRHRERIQYLAEDKNLDIECISMDDTLKVHWIGLSDNFRKSLVSVKNNEKAISLKTKMTEDMDDEVIYCSRINDKFAPDCKIKITLKLISNMFVKIKKPTSERTTYRRETLLRYSDNETIDLECNVKKSKPFTLVWLKDNKVINKNNANSTLYTLHALSKADDNSVYKCELRTKSSTITEVSIRLAYDPMTVESYATPYDTETPIDGTPTADGLIESGFQNLYLIIIFCFIVIAIIVIAVVLYKKYPCKSQKMLDRDGSYKNFENSYVTPPPELDTSYTRPVDDADQEQYYTYAVTPGMPRGQPPQETYSAPFVPTIKEMYTAPIKKGMKKPEYELPSKVVGYANLKRTLKGPTDPGYSNLSTANSDSSEIYDSSSVTYSRVK